MSRLLDTPAPRGVAPRMPAPLPATPALELSAPAFGPVAPRAAVMPVVNTPHALLPMDEHLGAPLGDLIPSVAPRNLSNAALVNDPRISMTPETELAARESPDYQPPTHGRGFNFLHMMLRAAGPAFQSSLERAAASGRPYGPAEFGQGLAATAGAGVVGLFDKQAVGRFDNERRIEQLQPQVQQGVARRTQALQERKLVSEIGETEARGKLLNAQAEAKPLEVEARALKQKQAAIQTEIKTRLRSPRPFNLDNPYDADLLRRASAAGVVFDEGAFGDQRNPFTLSMVDPDDPSGTRMTRFVFNRGAGEFEPLTVDGRGVTTGYVQPVSPRTGMTPAQEAGVTDRRAGQAATEQHRRVIEAQGAERIDLSRRQGVARRGQPTQVNQLSRDARAAELTRRLEEAKAKASSPPYSFPGKDGRPVQTTQAWRDDYTWRMKESARRYKQQIEDAFGDRYETGEDAQGWAYAKPRTQPLAPRGGGAATYSEADVRARARAAGKDENAAVAAARKAGLIQ